MEFAGRKANAVSKLDVLFQPWVGSASPSDLDAACFELTERIEGLEWVREHGDRVFRRRSDDASFVLFPATIVVPTRPDLLSWVIAQLEAAGLDPGEIPDMQLERVLRVEPASFQVPPFLCRDRLMRETEAHAIDVGMHPGRPDLDGDDIAAMLTAEDVLVVRERGASILSESQWLVMAQRDDGALSWLGAGEPTFDPGAFVTREGVGQLGLGEYVVSDRTAGDLVIRGGGALTWPWQHPAEWIQTLNGYRVAPEISLGFAGIREVITIRTP